MYAGQRLKEVFGALNVTPDFDYTARRQRFQRAVRCIASSRAAISISWTTASDHDETVDATFRVTGKEPELWHAETGTTEPVSFKMAEWAHDGAAAPGALGHGVRGVPQADNRDIAHAPEVVKTQVTTVEGPWNVAFQPGRGAPDSITLDDLADWSHSDDPGVKYFSGMGTYTKTMQASPDWFRKGSRLWIDLGDVKNLAVVTVNGKELGQAWHAPYRVDATSALKPGANEISIKVINAWVNRLIGDEQPGATKYTFADVKPYKANSPLLPSGLLGPVTLVREDGR